MKHLIVALMTSVVICVLHSCANTEPVEEEKEVEEEVDKLVARVSSVNHTANYVLIQRYGKLVIPEDSILYTLSSTAEQGKAASIKPTGEKLGQFLAADIISGELEVGDSVYLRNLEKKIVKSKSLPANDKQNVPYSQQEQQVQEQIDGSLKPKVEERSQEVQKTQEVPLLQPSDDTLLPIVE